MSFVVYNTETHKQVINKIYDTERGAKIACTRKFGAWDWAYQVIEYKEFLTIKALTTKKIKVKSLMSGKEVEIDEDTPLCCDPSSETFWSM
jgi:hypothetical protein